MEEQIAVSIVVPVYNAEKWLGRCVKSLKEQTLKKIEIILVDDGSSDESGKLCDEFAKSDSRIKVIHNINGGPSNARNTGMRIAEGEYIAFADSDDEVKLNMYEKMYEIAHDNNKYADIVMCNILHKSQQGEKILEHHIEKVYDGNDKIRKELLKLFYTGSAVGLNSPCNKLYRRELLCKHHVEFDENRVRAEDYFFNFYAFKEAVLIRTTETPYYIYYQDNENSIMHKYRENQYFEWKRDREEILEQLKEMSFDLDFGEFWRTFVYKTYMYIFKTISMNTKCKEKIMQIIKDDMLCQAVSCKCESYTRPMKILNWLIKMKFYNSAWISFVAIQKIKRYN